MARIAAEGSMPTIPRSSTTRKDQPAAPQTRIRAARAPPRLATPASDHEISKTTSNTKQRAAKDTRNIRLIKLTQQQDPLRMSGKDKPAPRIQRALKPLAHDNALFQPVSNLETRRTKRNAGLSTMPADKENRAWQEPLVEPQRVAGRSSLTADNSAVVEEEISVMESSGDEWNVYGKDAESASSDDEDDLPIKPTRASRAPDKSMVRRLQILNLADSDTEDSDQSTGHKRLSVSSSEDPTAILHFSPPSRSPHPIKPTSRPATPPASPSKSKLVSPSKTIKHIPNLPGHRPSLDAFWSADEVNKWNDQYSPKKVLKSPRKNPLLLLSHPSLGPPPSSSFSDSEEEEYIPRSRSTANTSPNKSLDKHKSPTKSASNDPEGQSRAATRALAASRKAFDAVKHSLATSFLTELDNTISKGEVSRLTASTGGVAIVWSKKLTSTAGRAHWRREALRTPPAAADGEPVLTHRHIASIEIATKVIDTAERLRNVLAHEYCHLANFMISRVTVEPHGASFKAWARKATAAFAHVGVEVTTKHSYEISYKYAWVCAGRQGGGLWGLSSEDEDEGCGTTYQRHSKSIDVARQGCGRCKGRLVQVRPVPRSGLAVGSKPGARQDVHARMGDGGEVLLAGKASKASTAKAKTGYQAFVSAQYKLVKAELGHASPMKEVMGEIGRRYRALKDGKPAGTNATDATSLDDETQKGQHAEDIDAVARKLDFLDLDAQG